MKDRASTEAQPWHPADEKPSTSTRKGAPIGTHSLTGRGAEESDPLAEPRR